MTCHMAIPEADSVRQAEEEKEEKRVDLIWDWRLKLNQQPARVDPASVAIASYAGTWKMRLSRMFSPRQQRCIKSGIAKQCWI